jgi:DNA-binding NarL/FixJ family response regulator
MVMSSVLIIEDHSLIAESLAIALGAEGFAATVATGKTQRAVLALAREIHPDVVLLDLDLGPQLGSGLDLLPELRKFDTRVVIVSGTTSRLDLAAAVERGAFGIVVKNQPVANLIAAVKSAVDGRAILASNERNALLAELYASRAARLRELEPFTHLTPREQEVLRGLIKGLRARDLAQQSSISQATVRTQIRGVLTKLSVSSQLEAVALARETGWVFASQRR